MAELKDGRRVIPMLRLIKQFFSAAALATQIIIIRIKRWVRRK